MNGRAALGLVLVFSCACAGILGLKPESSPEHAFEHRAHAEAGVHCLTCHDGVQRTGDTGELHIPMTSTCTSCHAKPHDTRDCNGCHGLPYTRAGASRARDVVRFEHAAHRQATKADCVRCHSDAGSGIGVLRPRMASCLSCHEHQGQMSAQDCGSCHVDLETEGTLPEDHLVHPADFATAHGAQAAAADGLCATCHSERECASCHAGGKMPTTPDRLAFDRPTGPGLHRPGFLARHALDASEAGGLCTTCHAPESCASCHDRERLVASGKGRLNPHPPGWIGPPGSRNDHGPATWRDPASCASCHGGAGEQLCVDCHQVGGPGGDPHPPGREPGGSKSRFPCARCHHGGR